MRSWLRSFILLGSVAAAFCPSTVAAYCPTTTCANTNAKTRPNDCIDDRYVCETGGTRIAWPKNCLSFSVQLDGSKKFGISADQLQAIVRDSFDNWQNVTCPTGGKPNFYVETYPQVTCSVADVHLHGRNQNLWVFQDEIWPHPHNANTAIALTTVSFHPRSGVIYDADVEFNSANFDFALETGDSGTDLRSVVQHESGHVLGLADLYDFATARSTMNGDYSSGEPFGKRTLEDDDAAGICAVFPPAASSNSCDPEPLNGFTRSCYEAIDDDGCSCVLGRPNRGESKSPWFMVGFLALARTLTRRLRGWKGGRNATTGNTQSTRSR